MRLSDGSVDFDYNPPHHSDIYGTGTFGLAFEDPDKLVWQAQVQVAPWSGKGSPDRDACVQTVVSNPLSSEEMDGYRYRVGDSFCSTTYTGKAIVYFKVTGKNEQTAKVAVIAWDAPEDRP
ncbi:hypothetical protein [Streptomyces canus]|uniref:hypothetical protein n=1 Tax=Streptomyces canus TaxID=58343 RepID=UPI002E33FDD4|nr:hypothetical protein [Streptomyces canus]